MQMTPTLQRDVYAEAYADVKNLIYSTVARFKRTYGGDDFDDLLGIAHVQFIRCCDRWREDRGRFTCDFATALVKWIWMGLIDAYRYENRDCRRMPDLLPDCTTVADRPDRTFNLRDFIDDLSDDAGLVVGLLFDSASEFGALVECRAEAKGGQPRNIRSSVREFLLGIGWTADQVRESFDEIRSAL